MRLLFLHALPFGGEMWEEEIRHFGPDAVAPTLYDEGETLEEWARAALGAVGDEPFIVVGSSIGGSCALEVARLAPGRVAGVVLIGAKAGVRPEPAERDRAVACLSAAGVDAAWFEFWRPLFGPDTSPTTLDHGLALARRVGAPSLARGVRAFHDRADRSDVAQRWTKPLVGICGEHDGAPGAAVMRALATGASRHFHVVNDCGHYVNLEQPQRLRRLLDEAVEMISSGRFDTR